jgi:hypothetical protein
MGRLEAEAAARAAAAAAALEAGSAATAFLCQLRWNHCFTCSSSNLASCPPHQTPRPSPAVKRKHEIRKLGSAEVVTHHRNARELRAFGGCGEVGEKPLHDSHACLGQLVGDSEGGSDLKGGGRALARRLRCARRRVLRHRAILCRAHGAPAPSTHPFREISRGSRRVQSGLRWVCVDEVPAEEGFGQVRGSG